MKRGFTLIELLVGIAVFSLILGAVIGIFISAIQLQRDFLKKQQVLNQLSFAIEYMSRALRMAKREMGEGCLATEDLNYENPGVGTSAVRFINHLQGDDCQQFFLEGNSLKYKKGIGVAEETYPLTLPGLVIEELKFQLQGESNTDSLQPRVTIFLKISSPLKIELQTTISQRNLDI